MWVKLSPNAGDIVSIAQAAEEAGADCLVIANTFLSLKIRTDNFRPALGNKFGGLVSPALKPIVLRMVYQVAKAVKIPIIGIGGVTKAEDVVEYMLAGASAVGIGYAAFRNPTALITIIDDLRSLVRRARHQEGDRTDRRGARRGHGDGHARRRIGRRLSSLFLSRPAASTAERTIGRSAWIAAANASGVSPTASTPAFSIVLTSSGSRQIATRARETLSMIGRGVPVGAK